MPLQREDSDSDGEHEEEDDEVSGEENEEEDDDNDDEDDDDDDEDDDGEEEEFEDETDEQEPIYDPNNGDEYQQPTKGNGVGTTRLSEQQEGDSSWRERNMAPLIACVFCCLCLIIVAVLLGVLLPKHLNKNNGDSSNTATIDVPTDAPVQAPFNPVDFPTPPPGDLTPSARPPPTLFPTVSPAPTSLPVEDPTPKPTDYPTVAPTISPAPTKSIPDQLGIIADQDTTVYLDGFYIGESYGQDPTFLIQNGPAGVQEVPDAVALLTFPLDDVPSFDRLTNIKKNAILRLNHEPVEESRGPATYTIVRMPGTPMRVEFLHGYIFKPPDDGTVGVTVGPEFTVNPDTTVVDIDVTSLLFEASEDDFQLYLMIQDRGAEKPNGGHRFYSREHADLKPQLLIDFQGGNAADVVVTDDNSNVDGTETGDGDTAAPSPAVRRRM
ncbi:hypothetical protein IV203_024455 [Nitzschia inconspicua]|uniref:Uncharacterized protein n=1 Tax=Nitzschia inconspicua TaxID=303405 RepID=A0A9K3KCA1_9STRA|nr:hypothetical protein IV203_024455 [Nitzschia inconspicua]